MASNSVPSCCLTKQEIYQFYAMDRELYTILAILLCRDPVESMKVMAFWLWLEKLGFPNVVKRMLALPLIMMNDLADETVTCLNAISGTPFSLSQSFVIPLLQAFMSREISVYFFYEYRYVAASGIAKVGRDVCVEALCDIMADAIEINRTAFQNSRSAANQSQMNLSPSNLRQPPSSARRNEVSPQDRTMFVTFSKGYPVQEYEVIEFFTRVHGDCIESLQMQEVQPFEQPLYGKIVFHSATTIEAILNGMSKAKFTINGKHVWVREFEARRTRPPSR